MTKAERRDALRPLRVAGVRVGVLLGVLAGILAAVNPSLPGSRVERVGLQYAIAAAAVVTALLVRSLPWDALLRRPHAVHLLTAWMLVDIGLITVGAANSGFLVSEASTYLFLVVIFATLVLPASAQAVALLGSVVAVTGLAVADPTARPAAAITRVGVLLLVGLLGNRVGAFLMDEYVRAYLGGREADRRATSLREVAAAARTVADLDPDRMMRSVVKAAIGLGFDVGNLCLFDDDLQSYEVRHPMGEPLRAYAARRHPTTAGMPALVIAAGRTVVVDDYANHPLAIPELARAGFRLVIGAPIHADGRLAGCLVAGATTAPDGSPAPVEAFELLAAVAGRALENARRFEAEQALVVRLQRLDQMKSDFVSNVSHELRTPLTIIEGVGSTLATRGDDLDPGMREDLLGRLNANARSLSDIVSRLLDFSRLEAGTVDVQAVPFDLAVTLRSIAGRLSDMFDTHRLITDVQGTLPVVADPALLERVIENLLVNGRRHTPGGTTVRLVGRMHDDGVLVAVEDDGPGVSPQEREHLLERFFRGGDPNTRETRGLGLGLALAAEVVALHGSRLQVDDAPGGGARFSFVLPPGPEAAAAGDARPADVPSTR